MEAINAVAEPQSATVRHKTSNLPKVAWSLALLPFIGLAIWRFGSGPGLAGDDWAQYLMHARALAEGRSYGDIGYIYSPHAHWIGPRAAPPGLPLLLAGAYAIFGPNMLVMKAITLCFAIAFVALAGAYFARHANRTLGFGVALLCGLSPNIIHASSQLLTDLPFAALLWAIILVMDEPGRFDFKRIVAVTVLGAWLALMRTAGLVLLPAIVVFTIVRWREHQLRPMVPVALWAVGLMFMAAVLSVSDTSVVRLGRLWFWLSNFQLINVMGYFEGVFEGQLYPFRSDRANDYFHVLSSALMLIGLLAWLPKSWRRFGTVFAVVYGLTLLIVPVQQGRYLWPLYPFIIFGVLNGVRIVIETLGGSRQLATAAVSAYAILICAGAVAAVAREPAPDDLAAVPAVREVYDYLQRVNQQTPARVSFPKPRSLTWSTQIPAMGPIYGPEPCLIAEFTRRRITHVVTGRVGPAERGVRALARMTRANPDYFSPVLRNRRFTVYRFHAPGAVRHAGMIAECDRAETAGAAGS